MQLTTWLDARRRDLLEREFGNSLATVGPDKPLGSAVTLLQAPGGARSVLWTLVVGAWRYVTTMGRIRMLPVHVDHDGKTLVSVYFYDQEALTALLYANKGVLAGANWPCDPRGFIVEVNRRAVPPGTRLYDLIADAYGDRTNPGRTDRQVSSWTALHAYRAAFHEADPAEVFFRLAYPRAAEEHLDGYVTQNGADGIR